MKFLKKWFVHFYSDSLYRNSFFLMASTAVLSIFGFLFWIIFTKIYSAEDIGLLTTLISTSNLIMIFGTLGWSNGLIRYLPTSLNKNALITVSFKLVFLVSTIVSILFILSVEKISPTLSFVRYDIKYLFTFIFLVVLSSLNYVTEAVFIAQKSSGFLLLRSVIFSFLKIIIPFVILTHAGYSLFVSIVIAQFFSVLVSIIALKFKFNIKLTPLKDIKELKRVSIFSLNIYSASIFGNLYTYLLPIIVLNKLGSANSAYYYMVLTIISTLSIIPISTTQSLFAEGSSDLSNLRSKITKTIRFSYTLLIPVVIILFFFGEKILFVFGKSYSTEGFMFLKIQSIGLLFSAINYVFGALLKITDKKRLILLTSIINTVLILAFSYLLISKGLIGIGYAAVITQILMLLIYAMIIYRLYSTHVTLYLREIKGSVLNRIEVWNN